MADKDIKKIYKEIEKSLGELQFMLTVETEEKYIKWLEKRIEYLKDNPGKQIKLGTLTMDDIKYKRKRVDGIKHIIKRIEKNKLSINN